MPLTILDALCVNAPTRKQFSGSASIIFFKVVDFPDPALPLIKPPYLINDLISSSSNISRL